MPLKNTFIALLLFVCADAAAEGRFCLVDNFGHASCMYPTAESCQQSARTLGGMCTVNVQQQQPRTQLDPFGSMIDGHRAGVETELRLQESQRAARAAAQREAPRRRIPQTFVEMCQANVAMQDGKSFELYGSDRRAIYETNYQGGLCLGLIEGYVKGRLADQEAAGKSCQPTTGESLTAAARRVAAIRDLDTPYTIVLSEVSKSWQCN